MAVASTKQTNVVVNEARNLVFFEGDDLAFNYKTNQWTSVPAYNGFGLYSLRGPQGKLGTIGLVRYVGNRVTLQRQRIDSHTPLTATITTGATDPNQGGRAITQGVRPLVNGGTYSVRVGTQDSITGDISWSPYESVNNRTGMANFRKEGRYHRVEVQIEGGFETAMGADIVYEQAGRV